ncbi:hypothetical protein [Shewanella pneumatophori]|uniref:Uncharacterized protein n=1 Tax=Shewanella pneumatophori TaxID=314092 RepID=A0A9X2CCE7_9GAMM|nr:hypothetical protein [Shewanella pneumatophori]MCL1137988.1 hypothetical protein [Shewanella pneumatophori]
MSLDSIYAMLAKPVIAKVRAKRKVKQLTASAQITPDNHAPQQPQLPEHLERRSNKEDRRQQQDLAYPLDPSLERRKAPTTDRRQTRALQENEDQSEPEQLGSTHTKIDINV